MSTKGINRRGFLKTAGAAAAAAGTAQFFAPAILKAQQQPIKIGHLVPLTGFLSPMGDFASKAGKQAIEEINAAGGVLGRKLETIVDDETNPGVGVQKATKMIQQDKVDFLLGTVSSAVALAIMDVAERYQKIFFNTGSNSDEIRGAKCNYYTFCTEASNTQYVKAIGRYLVKNKNYKTFYILTSDYAFGHDLTRVTRRLLNELGGKEIGHDLVPTGTADYSSYLLKVRNAKPEVIFCNVAGGDQTTFLKQYTEFGLKIDVAGGVTDTVLMWNAGKDTAQGVWTVIWWGDLNNEYTKKFVSTYRAKYGQPPENQAWGDYTSIKVLAEAIKMAGTTDSKKVVEALEKVKFDGGKGRELYYRTYDHQLMQPMYVVDIKKTGNKDKWDIFNVVGEVPGKDESLEVIAPTKEENPCNMKRA
ncbi:MAG: transporter substrate-binding protein [candidate division NC10 bacterium]|jgi:branched-chain amino acid transport system substrate-binding protein|nr:transporter substrate-binding protein [candidate division NC10 bacterium]